MDWRGEEAYACEAVIGVQCTMGADVFAVLVRKLGGGQQM